MKQIIGNQDRERQPRVDTEKWKEHKKYYDNMGRQKSRIRTKKTGIEGMVQQDNIQKYTTLDENKLLEYDYDGKPRLKITPIYLSMVNTKTPVEYDRLMMIYEAGGWKWNGGESPTDREVWSDYEKDTCITLGTGILSGGLNRKNRNIYIGEFGKSITSKIMSFKNFCDTQKISKETIDELVGWYAENKMNRESSKCILPF